MKAILAAAALAIAASAVPAAAYEGEHHHHRKSTVGRTMTKSYLKHDSGIRQHHSGDRWWHRRHRERFAEYQPHHRRHWWRYWD